MSSLRLSLLHVFVDFINFFLLVSSLFFSFHHSILAERGGVSALRPAHTVHPSLSQTQHLPSYSALQSMSSSTSLFPSVLWCRSVSVCSCIFHLRFSRWAVRSCYWAQTAVGKCWAEVAVVWLDLLCDNVQLWMCFQLVSDWKANALMFTFSMLPSLSLCFYIIVYTFKALWEKCQFLRVVAAFRCEICVVEKVAGGQSRGFQ